MFTPSLPQLEAQARAEEQSLRQMPPPAVPAAENYLVSGATAQLIDKFLNSQALSKRTFANVARAISAIRAAIHRYVTDCAIALELGVGLLKDGTPPLQKHAPLPASA